MGILNYSTEVDSQRTISEIMAILRKGRAAKILTEFGPQQEVAGLSFTVAVGGRELGFRLPVRTDIFLKAMQLDATIPRRYVTRAQAERVAWRIIKRWIEAQMALIATGMVKTEEVFLPYMVSRSGSTLYEIMAGQNFLLSEGKG